MLKNVNSKFWAVLGLTILIAVIISVSICKLTGNKAEKFAVVDLQRVVVVAKEVAALKSERDMQIAELQKMAEEANAKISDEKNEKAKKKLSEQLLVEINKKKESFDRMYASALQASDRKLNEKIAEVAKKEGYSVVMNKSGIIAGGTDITEKVIEAVR
ncbi:MAG: OmpH family outer membrane protein [Alphaproteobacteria bacterium]|nr:OmpH family outer membrane protein [Alphaproteobacteria bacterium]